MYLARIATALKTSLKAITMTIIGAAYSVRCKNSNIDETTLPYATRISVWNVSFC